MFEKKKPKRSKTVFTAIIVSCATAFGCAFGMGVSRLAENDEAKTNVVYTQGAEAVDLSENPRAELTDTEIAQKVGPAVVGIQCSVSVRTIFGTQKGTSSGSGIIISEDGTIVTNYHVIENAEDITVILNTGDELPATLVGGDEKSDLAVIKVETTQPLTVAAMGNSDELLPGDRVVAIGNPLGLELFGTVTAGIISGLNRTIKVDDNEMTFIQTDAAINSGNSGGALINAYGEVIGINSAKISTEVGEGLGFAIPANTAAPIITDLIEVGYVRGRPLIGVNVVELTQSIAFYNNLPVDSGLYVMSVTEGSGAESAGLRRGDIILSFDSQAVTTMKELNAVRDNHKVGDSVPMEIDRDGNRMTLTITLSEDRQ